MRQTVLPPSGFATAWLVVAAVLAAAGCGQSPSARQAEGGRGPAAVTSNSRPTDLPYAPPGAVPTAPKPADEVGLKVVTYDQLIAAVKAERGKVVVADIWAEY